MERVASFSDNWSKNKIKTNTTVSPLCNIRLLAVASKGIEVTVTRRHHLADASSFEKLSRVKRKLPKAQRTFFLPTLVDTLKVKLNRYQKCPLVKSRRDKYDRQSNHYAIST